MDGYHAHDSRPADVVVTFSTVGTGDVSPMSDRILQRAGCGLITGVERLLSEFPEEAHGWCRAEGFTPAWPSPRCLSAAGSQSCPRCIGTLCIGGLAGDNAGVNTGLRREDSDIR